MKENIEKEIEKIEIQIEELQNKQIELYNKKEELIQLKFNINKKFIYIKDAGIYNNTYMYVIDSFILKEGQYEIYLNGITILADDSQYLDNIFILFTGHSQIHLSLKTFQNAIKLKDIIIISKEEFIEKCTEINNNFMNIINKSIKLAK